MDLTPLSGASTSPTVTVCKPASLRILSNYTRGAGGILETGVAYPLHVGIVDAAGRVCRGDTGAAGTLLTLDAVRARDFGPVSLVNLVVNVNTTNSTSTYPTHANEFGLQWRTVRPISGSFMFSLMFTNSTVANNISGGVSVRITSSLGNVIAPASEVVVKAVLMTVAPQLPRFIIVGEPLYFPYGGEVTVSANDGLPQAFIDQGIVARRNVPLLPMEIGYGASFFWRISPATASFPITFSGASQDASFTAGRRVFPQWTWTGATGEVTVDVRSTTLAPSALFPLTIQARSSIAYGITSSSQCTSTACDLPTGNSSFTKVGTDFQIQQLMFTQLNVSIVDASGKPVIGDQTSVIALNFSTASTTLFLIDSVTLQPVDVLLVRVVNGSAAFNFTLAGFVTNSTSMRLNVFCPPTRPSHMLTPGDRTAANPCASLTAINSKTIVVPDTSAPRALFSTAAVLGATPIIKGRSFWTTVETFNGTQFAADVARHLYRRGFLFVEPRNAEKMIHVVSCEVERDRFQNSDLGNSVCQVVAGIPELSCSTANNHTCPNAVQRCACPSSNSARRMLWQRYLLNTYDVQFEISFDLWRARTFSGRTERDIIDALSLLRTTALDILRTNRTLQDTYRIDPTSIDSRTAVSVVVTAPDPTTTPVPPTPRPATNAPPTPIPMGAGHHTLLTAMVILCISLMFAL